MAQTNIQLYNQLRECGLPLDDLALVNRAYELLTTLYPGYVQADGKPFVSHGVGVASIMAGMDMPAEAVAAALLHNAYGNGDFGDGRQFTITPRRRKLVSAAVGDRVEQMLARFQDLRVTPDTIAEFRRTLPERDATDRMLLLIDLADRFEKYVDMGVLYFGDGDWVLSEADRIGPDLVQFAHELGQPELGGALAAAMADATAREPVPAELRPSNGRRYLELIVPRSCRRRLLWRVQTSARRAGARLRPRRRLRRLRRRAVGRLRAPRSYP